MWRSTGLCFEISLARSARPEPVSTGFLLWMLDEVRIRNRLTTLFEASV
jgi:hypothetical protein